MASRALDHVSTAALVICALAVGGAAVKREFFNVAPDARRVPVLIEGWEAMRPAIPTAGRAGARLSVIEFADFECPFCRRLHPELKAHLASLGDEVEYRFVHYPLPNHVNAEMASLAAVCGESQGRFMEMASALYASQDSIGTLAWSEFARRANVPDLRSFADCMRDSTKSTRVERDKTLGDSLRIRGTPTLVVNGWRYDGVSPDSVRAVLARGGRP